MADIPNNYGGLEKKYSSYNNSQIVILPIPFDKTSTWVKGAKKGPTAIIEASKNMELYDIETKSEVFKKGIFTAKPIKEKTSEEMVKKSYSVVKKFLIDKKFITTLGGEHSVSYGPIKAYSELFPNLSILHLDAHSDRRDTYEETKFSHACIMARAEEMVKNVVSVGIRSLDTAELKSLKQDKIFFAEQIINSSDWQDKVNKQLSNQVYISIDLDVLIQHIYHLPARQSQVVWIGTLF
jgi:agmatinase